MKPLIITIDGPSATGKGTVARAVAARLRYRHVDTGAMYRAVAWQALQEGLDPTDEAAVATVARRIRLDLEGEVRVDGRDVTNAIRTAEIDAAAATVARLPAVRDVLVCRQRDMGHGGGIVMEGRDIGTVVFPEADVKIFLDATPEERARRRAGDATHASGRQGILADVALALDTRDRLDRTRAASPLVPAAQAVLIDTTGVAIDEVVTRVMAIVEQTLRQQGGQEGGPTRG